MDARIDADFGRQLAGYHLSVDAGAQFSAISLYGTCEKPDLESEVRHCFENFRADLLRLTIQVDYRLAVWARRFLGRSRSINGKSIEDKRGSLVSAIYRELALQTGA